MRKQTEQTSINPDQPAELVLNLGTGMEAFTISGDAEVLQPLAEEAMAYDKALEARQVRQTVKHASHIGKSLVEASTHVTGNVIGRLAMDVKTIAYDKAHGTSFYDSLKQKRDDERNLRFATSIGLVSLQDVTCRKHQAAIAKMRGL